MKTKHTLAFDRKGGETIYTILCIDDDKKIGRIVDYIGKTGGTGHSFSIIVDPDDSENKKTFAEI